MHFFTFTLLPHQTLSLHNSTACSNSFWWHWHFRLRSQPAWTGSGKALANSSPHQPIPGDMTFHNTLSTCLVTVLCEASMITLQTVDDWLLSCSDASSDGVPYRFTKCDVSLRRCKIEQTKVFQIDSQAQSFARTWMNLESWHRCDFTSKRPSKTSLPQALSRSN